MARPSYFRKVREGSTKKSRKKSGVLPNRGEGAVTPNQNLFLKKKKVFRKIFRWILCLIKLGWLCELEVLVTLY